MPFGENARGSHGTDARVTAGRVDIGRRLPVGSVASFVPAVAARVGHTGRVHVGTLRVSRCVAVFRVLLC